jgi:transketolase
VPLRTIENPFQYGPEKLADAAKEVRRSIIRMNSSAGAGHTGADLSETDILVTLYFAVLRYDMNLEDPERDRFILSKGHGAGGFYCTLAEAGLIKREHLSSYLAFDSPLPGHPVKHKLRAVELNTGALGHGFSVAVGLALSAKMRGRNFTVYVLVGDGELQEGSNWEAAMSAASFGLDNLVVIVDRNGLQLADRTEKIMKLNPLDEKFKTFGFRVVSADGNDPASLLEALRSPADETSDETKNETRGEGRPTVIIADTVKGKGISFIEDNPAWHHRIPKGEEVEHAIEELE